MATSTVKTQLTDYTQQPLEKLLLSDIAYLIKKDWRKTSKNGIYFGAVPYLDAMTMLSNVNQNYIMDSGKSIVIYFLANSQTWKGEVARLVKAHLNKLIKNC